MVVQAHAQYGAHVGLEVAGQRGRPACRAGWRARCAHGLREKLREKLRKQQSGSRNPGASSAQEARESVQRPGTTILHQESPGKRGKRHSPCLLLRSDCSERGSRSQARRLDDVQGISFQNCAQALDRSSRSRDRPCLHRDSIGRGPALGVQLGAQARCPRASSCRISIRPGNSSRPIRTQRRGNRSACARAAFV